MTGRSSWTPYEPIYAPIGVFHTEAPKLDRNFANGPIKKHHRKIEP
jgi:hypothetical protein